MSSVAVRKVDMRNGISLLSVLVLLMASLVAATTSASAAPSGNLDVLVFGQSDNGFEADNLASTLDELGYNVDREQRLPSDVQRYSAIWYVEAYAGMLESERDALIGYVSSGGSVYLTGERPCCEALNGSVEAVLRGVLKDQDVVVGSQGDIQGPFTFNPSAKGQVVSNPNVLLDFVPSSPGGISGLFNVDSPNVLASNGTIAVGGVWDEDDTKANQGRIALLMDIDFLGSDSRVPIVQNLANFLSKGTSCGNEPVVNGISWRQGRTNCTTIVDGPGATWSISADGAAALAVAANGVEVSCQHQAEVGSSDRIMCDISRPTTPSANLTVTATGPSGDSYRYYRVVAKNDARNVPVPYSLSSDWWDWPDTDRDGLPDKWENEGVWVSGRFLNLPQLGAKSSHKDLFVYFDFEQGQPLDQAVFDLVRERYADAPVANPDGSDGINFHLTRGAEVPTSVIGDYDLIGAPLQRVLTYSGFSTKPEAGGLGVPPIYKHFLNYNRTKDKTPGTALVDGAFGWIAYDDLNSIVAALTLTKFPGEAANWLRSSMIFHEIGHTLGLEHHGKTATPERDPRYRSVMSYTYNTYGVKTERFPLPAQFSIDYSSDSAVNRDWVVGKDQGNIRLVTGQFGTIPDFYYKSANGILSFLDGDMVDPDFVGFDQLIRDTNPSDFLGLQDQLDIEGSPQFPAISTGEFKVKSGVESIITPQASDPAGDYVEVVLDELPLNGTAIAEGSTIRYRSDAGFVGEDSVKAHTRGARLSSDSVQIRIVVEGVDQPPTTTPSPPTSTLPSLPEIFGS